MTEDPRLYYGETAPADAVRPYVAACWHFRVAAGVGTVEHTIPPDGSVSLWYRPGVPGLGATGPHSRPLRVDVHGGDLVWGVRFWPGTAGALLPLDAEALRDGRRLPGELALGGWEARLCDRLRSVTDEAEAAAVWSTALLERTPDASPVDEAVMKAVLAIITSSGVTPIAAVAERVGLSPRQLRRRFRTAVGLSPKELARVRRIRASLVGALDDPEESWIGLAAAYGYSDQAHLVREYRRVVGLPPVELRAHLRGITHGDVLDR